MADLNHNPHIRDSYSPLDTLSKGAIRIYGEYSTDTIDGEVALMLLDFANMVIDDVRAHPYASDDDKALDYYTSITDAREVDDSIMRAGLLFLFAAQQRSEDAGVRQAFYYQTLNRQMWNRYNGNSRIKMRIVDGGTNPSYEGSATSTINGYPEPSSDS